MYSSKFRKMMVVLLILPLVTIANNQKHSIVDAASWDPAKASIVRKNAIIKQSKSFKKSGNLIQAQELLNNRDIIETGINSPPHTKAEVEQRAIEKDKKYLSTIFQKAQIIAQETNQSFTDVFKQLLPKEYQNAYKSTAVTMYIKTPSGESVTYGNGYAFDSSTGGVLAYFSIGSLGEISINIDESTKVDFFIVPGNIDQALQVVKDVTIEIDKEIKLEPSIPIKVELTNAEDGLLNNIVQEYKLEYFFNGYKLHQQFLKYPQDDHVIYVLPQKRFMFTVKPEAPYITPIKIELTSSESNQLNIAVKKGVTIQLNYIDPDNLVGENDCYFYSGLRTNISVNAIQNFDFTDTSYIRNIYNDAYQLTGSEFAVPKNSFIDFELNNYVFGNVCLLANEFSRRKKYADDTIINIILRRRPMLNIISQTPQGETSNNSQYVIFDKHDKDKRSIYHNGNYSPNFVAGKTYTLQSNQNNLQYPSESTFIAKPGQNELLYIVQKEISNQFRIGFEDPDLYQYLNYQGLIEFYQNEKLIKAFEFGKKTIKVDIPSGNYDVKFSGLTGKYYDLDLFKYHYIVLQPFWEQIEITEHGAIQEILLSMPNKGVTLEFPETFRSQLYTLEVLENNNVVAVIPRLPIYEGKIITDYDELNFSLRGENFSDVEMVVFTDETFPNTLLSDLAEESLMTTVKIMDESGQPLINIDVNYYQENGLNRIASYATSNDTGEFEVKKIKNSLLYLKAPNSGNLLGQFVDVNQLREGDVNEIVLKNLDFHDVVESQQPQLLYGNGNNAYQIVFLAEGYSSQKESFVDENGNGVWDGIIFIDFNDNNIWDAGGTNVKYEPLKIYGDAILNYNEDSGTNISANNEPFDDLNNDGYPSINDFAVFVQNSKDYIRALLVSPEIYDVIDFDVYILFKDSNQAGTDIINTDDEKIIDYDTAFGSYYTFNRSLLGISENARSYVNSFFPNRDLTVAMLNQPVRLGRVNAYILAYGGVDASSPNSFVNGHEFGHNPGGLADEYDEFGGTSHYQPRFKSHMSNSLNNIYWKHLLEVSSNKVSAPNSFGNGIYAGGNYNSGGIFRSTSNSRMRNTKPLFNDISQEIMTENITKKLCIKALTELSNPDECFVATAGKAIQPGFYYDKAHNGHGFVIEPIGVNGLYFIVFYTYDENGMPEWYTSISKLENGIMNISVENNTLSRFNYDFSADLKPQSINNTHPNNRLTLDFNYSDYEKFEICDENFSRDSGKVAVATWQLGSEQLSWCIEPLIKPENYPSNDVGGIWWAGNEDEGWGLSITFSKNTLIAALYFYDAQGKPRWSLGLQQGFNLGEELTLDMKQYTGYGRDQEQVATSSEVVGTMKLNLNSNNSNTNSGVVSINVTYNGEEGGIWQRVNVPITNITSIH